MRIQKSVSWLLKICAVVMIFLVIHFYFTMFNESEEILNQVDPIIFDESLLLESHFEHKGDSYIVTFLTFEYISMFRNFMKSLDRIGRSDEVLVLLCKDEKVTKEILKEVKNYVLIDLETPSGGRYGSEDYFNILGAKFYMLQLFPYLKREYPRMKRLMYFDVDVVFLNDPFEKYFDHFEFYSNDEWNPNLSKSPEMYFLPECINGDEEKCDQVDLCAGGFIYRPTKRIEELFVEIQEHFVMNIGKKIKDKRWVSWNDQKALNRYLRSKNETYTYKLLPSRDFPNGRVFRSDSYQKLIRGGFKPCIVHLNWVRGLDKKIEMAKEHGLWYLDN